MTYSIDNIYLNHNNFKGNKMKHVILLTAAVCLPLSLALSACNKDDDTQPQVIGNFYTNINDCISEYGTGVCVTQYYTALNQAIENAPKFSNISDCTDQYGSDGCATTSNPTVDTIDQHPGDVFMPKFQGFSVLVDYNTDEDEDGNTISTPTYSSAGYVYQPGVYVGYHPFIFISGPGYSRTVTRSIYTTRVNGRTVATTGVRVGSTYSRPSVTSVTTSISRSGFGTRSFSSSRSISVSRGGFGSRAGGFGGTSGG